MEQLNAIGNDEIQCERKEAPKQKVELRAFPQHLKYVRRQTS